MKTVHERSPLGRFQGRDLFQTFSSFLGLQDSGQTELFCWGINSLIPRFGIANHRIGLWCDGMCSLNIRLACCHLSFFATITSLLTSSLVFPQFNQPQDCLFHYPVMHIGLMFSKLDGNHINAFIIHVELEGSMSFKVESDKAVLKCHFINFFPYI